MNRPSPRVSQFKDISYHKLEVADNTVNMKDVRSPAQKENSYYMDNYEATVTVHKSPPQTRKQYFDFLEIDDETLDVPERTFPASRLSKRKNLRVTFSDHIEVDFIDECVDDRYLSEDEVDGYEGVAEEIMYQIPLDINRGIKQIASSAEFKRVSENISPTSIKSGSSSSDSNTTTSVKQALTKPKIVKPTKCQHQIEAAQLTQQPLLHKRRDTAIKVSSSLNDSEKKPKQLVTAGQDKQKKPENQFQKLPKPLLPDISPKVKSQPSYKQFITNAKRAADISRRYERPWVSGATATQSTFSVWRKRSETVRRTASLPKNFKLPDDLARKSRSEKVLLTGGNRVQIKNT